MMFVSVFASAFLRDGQVVPDGHFLLRTSERARPAHSLPKRIYRVKMRDGTHLNTIVYFPAGYPVDTAPAGVPTLGSVIIRTPYDAEPTSAHEAPAWCGEGFALVTQDQRGAHQSEGNFSMFHYANIDGYDTLAWISRQAWSNGLVGQTGASVRQSARLKPCRSQTTQVPTSLLLAPWTGVGDQRIRAADKRLPRPAAHAEGHRRGRGDGGGPQGRLPGGGLARGPRSGMA